MKSRADRPVVTEAINRTEEPGEGGEIAPVSVSGPKPRDTARSDVIVNLAHTALDILAGESSKQRRIPPKVTDHCVNAFCSLLMSGRMKPALNFAQMFARRGADYEAIVENLFTAAARRMEDRWVTDKVSMIDVNIGSSTLTRTHIALRSMLKEPVPTLEASALFGSFTGQSHVLGLSFAAEHFRRNGWNVRHMPGTHQGAFLAGIAAKSPDIVGLTAATDRDLKILQSVIDQIRKLHANPRIIVGGSYPNLTQLNADAVVTRLDMGLLAAHRLLA
jgi:methanogenic corrinoid protein MtbC1